MNILEKIILHKQEEIKERSRVTPIDRIKGSQRLYAIRDFKSALTRENVQIIAIGMSSFSNNNGNWTSGNSIPVLVDPSPYNVWTNWGADQWDLFFLDSNGNYVKDFNISTWDYDRIYNTILTLSSP